jgi:hypothetical protein
VFCGQRPAVLLETVLVPVLTAVLTAVPAVRRDGRCCWQARAGLR